MKDNKVEMPELLEDFTIENYIFSPADERVGIAILSENQGELWIMRVYQLLNKGDGTYYFAKELEAFSFKNRLEFDDFMQTLPSMSAFELMMVMNNATPGYQFSTSSN